MRVLLTKLNVLTLSIVLFISVQACSQPSALVDSKSQKQFEKAKILYQKKDLSASMKLLRSVIDRSPKYPDPHMLKFQIHQEAGEYAEAEKELETVVEISPNFFPNAHLFLGRIAFSRANYEKALKSCERYIKYRDISQNLLDEAEQIIGNSRFAIEAIKHPVPFEPESMGEAINSKSGEYFPSLTANDQTLLFTRRVMAKSGDHEQEDFYMSTKVDGIWQKAEPLRFINTPMNEGAPSISADGELIVFTACENVYGDYGGTRRGLGSCDLFFSFRAGDRWTKPSNMGKNINSANWETQPSISADGKTLYFIRAKKRNHGIKDPNIFISHLDDNGQWTPATKLSSVINTPGDESSVLIHPDGKTLYFTSDGHVGMGREDVFLSRKDVDGNWTKPMNLGYPINTNKNENSLVVSASGEVAYFASDREGGFGGLDLYKFDLYEAARPVEVSYVEGKVFDKDTQESVQARFELIDVKSGDLVVESYSNSVDGKFLVSIPVDREYALNVSSPGYLFYSDHFSFDKGTKAKPYELDIPLSKIKSGLSIVLENIFFDTDKYDLKGESDVEIGKIYDFLTDNSSLSVQIVGHTDNVGSETHNQLLSENRAKAVMNKLVLLGVPQERITFKGIGSRLPIASNETEEGRAINRRTEIKIL